MAGGEFLGRGWAFDLSEGRGVGPGPDGRVAEAGGEEKIRQSIWLILSTAPGERPTRPDFGCGIHELVFAPRTAGTLGEIIRAVTEALSRWEPR
ncbi:MAG TPA: GPW/gp25 family protein, partial [Polyangiaceae bacterium]|nr:GPW/gp25 family protein [Polyangiaceae bacterium]